MTVRIKASLTRIVAPCVGSLRQAAFGDGPLTIRAELGMVRELKVREIVGINFQSVAAETGAAEVVSEDAGVTGGPAMSEHFPPSFVRDSKIGGTVATSPCTAFVAELVDKGFVVNANGGSGVVIQRDGEEQASERESTRHHGASERVAGWRTLVEGRRDGCQRKL